MSTILGEITTLDPSHTATIFVVTLSVLICIEKIVDFTDKWCEANRFKHVFEKLQNHLLNLGLISFLLFFIDLFASQSDFILNSLPAFEFTHIVLFFVAISFVSQAIFLVQVMNDTLTTQNNSFLQFQFYFFHFVCHFLIFFSRHHSTRKNQVGHCWCRCVLEVATC